MGGDDEVVTAPRQPVFFEECARGDCFDHLTPNDAFGLLGIFDLFADGHAMPLRDQLLEILRRRFNRYSGKWYAVAPGSQGDVEDPRRYLGVVVEHFIKVTHPKKEDLVAMMRLDLPILLEQRTAVRDRQRHLSATTKGWPPSLPRILTSAATASARVAKAWLRTLKNPFSRAITTA